MGPVADSVMRLCNYLQGINYKLFMDNLFTSLKLLRKQRAQEIHVVGTLRNNRVPNIQSKLKASKSLARCGVKVCNIGR